MKSCILCQRPLSETSNANLWLHEEAEDCLVRIADRFGVSLDDEYEVQGDDIYNRAELAEAQDIIVLPTWKPVDEALADIFRNAGLQRLGGRSTGSGWSSVSQFQRCRYAWKKTYLVRDENNNEGQLIGEILPLAIGILVHVYLAIHYQRMLVSDYPLTPDDVNRLVREAGCNPEVFLEAWRLYTAYRLYYKDEKMIPLAVEQDLVDPRTRKSCRYDLIAYFPEESPARLPGTYVLEHKSAARFDKATLEGWLGDGEILGQVDLWELLHLDKRYGPLRGVLVNILGKQKVPMFHRTLAAPTIFAIDQHRNDLRSTNAEIQLAVAKNDFPRSRANCIGRYGFCNFWEHCNLGEE